ncbi:MAG: hypothetical protein LBO20_03080, partial [Bifidobacteriaceae bacterium]|nr:hypothetical protein [Bifidobacteriaceae bacterium]
MAASSRSQARRRAVELVFEAFQRGCGLAALVAERSGPDLHPYAAHLASGVAERGELISEWLDTYSKGWPQHRMPA